MMPMSRIRTSAAFIAPSPAGRTIYLVAPGDPEDNHSKYDPSGRHPAPADDLPYKVEIWNAAGSAVDQVIAVTANASIGYAAYYAAIREYPDRPITLRHKNSVVARWNGPKH
jgi:hypothetical protein